ncbi:MAG TPA: DUF499 domain-containing protein [Chloroflexia bacterium]|nr:DUF499 domain-containing protein [Chloroflexia bacterium]
MAQSWWDVVRPHVDVITNLLSPDSFGADLDEVVSGKGQADYRDPQTFFRRTFMTAQLRTLLADLLRRLAGLGGVEPIVQLATPFGGGKTHTLLAIYHLIKSGGAVVNDSGVKSVLQQAELVGVPQARIAALVGTALNVGGRHTPEGFVVHTLWGEIAYQLGGPQLYEFMRQDDESLTSPGDAKLKEMLRRAGPSVILLDETLPYMEKAAAKVIVGESTLARQTLVFIQELQQAVSASERCAFFYTLPGSETEQYGAKAQEAYRILTQLQQVAGRLEAIRVPVQGDDIFEVVRRRLFEDLGDNLSRQQAVDEYVEYYQRYHSDLPAEVQSSEYRARLAKAYPFHPRLIEILFERWGTLPGFQRTRGVLQLLAQVVGLLYTEGRNGKLSAAGFILPADLPLANPNLRSLLTRYTGTEFESVIASDIVGGSESKAQQIDRELGTELQKMRYAQGMATAIFFYSFGGGNILTQGASEAELRLAVSRTADPPIFGEVLSRFERRMWYLYKEGELYKYRSQPNLNKVISEAEDNISRPQRVGLLTDQLASNLTRDKDVFQALHFNPAETRDVPDVPGLRLVVMPPDLSMSGNPEQDEPVYKVLREYNDKAGLLHRTNKNSLVFLLADSNGLDLTLRQAQQVLALRSVETRLGNSDELNRQQKRDLGDRRKLAEDTFPRNVQQAYRHVVVFVQDMKPKALDLGGSALAGQSMARRVAERLKQDYLLLDQLDLNQQFNRWNLWPAEQASLNFKTLAGYFHQYTYLPRLTDVNRVLRTSIMQAVRDGQFGLATGSNDEAFQRVYRNEDTNPAFEGYPPESIWLIRQERALELKPPVQPQSQPVVEGSNPPKPTGSDLNGGGVEIGGQPPANNGNQGSGPKPPAPGRHGYSTARFDIAISPDRYGEQFMAILEVLGTLKNSASNVRINLILEADSGQLDDYEIAQELLSQHGIRYRPQQD